MTPSIPSCRRRRFVRRDDADPGHRDMALADQLGGDPVHRIDRDREADAGRGAGAGDDRAVDPDQPAGAVEQAVPPELPGLTAASVWITPPTS